MESVNRKDEASLEREEQRTESEARSIIHDLQGLYTLPEEKKTRWVWELLQNAKDVAPDNGVEIKLDLTSNELVFSHNGIPFKTKNLLAILYKTSTKSLAGEGGTTGKYGTGFVTTHILNKKLTISGIHENDLGKREFNLTIDRSAASMDENLSLKEMKQSLADTFLEIEKIVNEPAIEINKCWHSFSYSLNSLSQGYAERGLIELERNIEFTLLINPRIKNIIITTPTKSTSYTLEVKETVIEGVHYISVNKNSGLLYISTEKLVFGLPVSLIDNIYTILPIEKQAILFKEFPLIGTEDFNLPIFIQHQDFHPTEGRDAIRTKILSEEENDPIASKNRSALLAFKDAYIPFMQAIFNAEVQGTHFLAQSGLPALVEIYSNIPWYQENIQQPIRDFILTQKIVKCYSDDSICIAEAKFIVEGLHQNDSFYSLASRLLPKQIPNESSIWQWSKIISQDKEFWPANIHIDEEILLNSIPANIDFLKDESIVWLKDLYSYLFENILTHLGDKYPIYLNEAGYFCLTDQVFNYPPIDPEFMAVSKGLGRVLENEFLDKRLGKIPSIKPFDLNEFFNFLNKDLISDLKTESASPVQVASIFRICSIFRSDRAIRRESWYKIIKELLPDLVPDRIYVSVEYENFGRSAESWSIRYISYLIDKSGSPTEFASIYFDGHEVSFFDWYNKFLSFVFTSSEELQGVVLKKPIIPTQSNEFRTYDDFIFSEKHSEYFDESIKQIFEKYTTRGNPKRFLIDNRILIDGIRSREVDSLTDEIDKLFQDPNIEVQVKKDGPLNEMFLQLNSWFEQVPNGENYLRTFSGKRASLYILALGDGFSQQIIELQRTGKSMEEITALAKVNLSSKVIEQLAAAAESLGTDKLLSKVQELLDAQEEIIRWKKIGTAAELAFKQALAGFQPNFIILNPDIGKDFVIVANGKAYAIEIKSVDANKPNVRMSILQGETAVKEKDQYSLSVISRPEDNSDVTTEFFISEAKFVIDIGTKIGTTIEDWYDGLNGLYSSSDIKVAIDDKRESLYISRPIWQSGISFFEFVTHLAQFFKQPVDEIN